MKTFSRRQLALGFSLLPVAACLEPVRALATSPSCTSILPGWVLPLRRDLEAMAKALSLRLKPWSGPKRTFTPEIEGYLPARHALATAFIQAAIDAASASGGGTVRLAKGDYVSGTIVLKSHVRLQIDKGARLLGSTDLGDYPEHVARRRTVQDTNMGMHQSLIFAEDCEDIALTGEGVIDGRGSTQNFPGAETIHGTPGRPFVIRIIDCKRVHVRGLSLKDGACWMQNYLNCDDLLIESIRVENQANFNNDGLDIDGCRSVIVRHCHISSGDDSLCFKGASQRPTQGVLVEHCTFYSSCNAIKLGTDSQSVFKDVLVRHCEVGGVSESMRRIKPAGADSGVSWEMVDGGLAENIYCHDIHIVRARSPLFMRLENRGRVQPDQPKPAIGTLRRVVFEHLTGEDNGSRGCYFLGVPEQPIEDIVLFDVKMPVKASDDWLKASDIPDMRGVYPDAHMIDKAWGGLGKKGDKPRGGDGPAYGLWARDVKALKLFNVTFTPSQAEQRPQFLLPHEAQVRDAQPCEA